MTLNPGCLNEHIVATALYYYDSDNVEDSHTSEAPRLEFRQSVDTETMIMKPAQVNAPSSKHSSVGLTIIQSENDSVQQYYGVEEAGQPIQYLGSVSTHQDRFLAFPNVLQHRVREFELTDKTRPGHRKLLAMFLVDPHIRVISTAHVPPQRKDWWALEVRKVSRFKELPQELFDRIINFVEGFPVSWERAIAIRESLMDERGTINQTHEDNLFDVS